MKREKLTKSYLESIGIISVDQYADGLWSVTRRTATRSGGSRTSQIMPRINNGTYTVYLMIRDKVRSFQLARIVYAWHFSDVLPDEEVCFVDGDPLHVFLGNLKKMGQKEAVRYRKRSDEDIAADVSSSGSEAIVYLMSRKASGD